MIVKRFVPHPTTTAAHCCRVWRSALSEHVTDQIPGNVKARVRLLAVRTAQHLARSQQLDAAARILENYLTVHGAEAEILRLLGGLRLRQGRARDAALLLERALEKHFECTAAKRVPAAPAAETDAQGENEPGADQVGLIA
jgi:hypothetical protein